MTGVLWRLVARCYDWLIVHNACPCCWAGRAGDRFCGWMDVRVYQYREFGK